MCMYKYVHVCVCKFYEECNKSVAPYVSHVVLTR